MTMNPLLNIKDITRSDQFLNFYFDYNEGLIDADCCFTWKNKGFKPSINCWTYEGLINDINFPKIENYKIWLSFFCDYVGYTILIYYPEKAKEGQEIDVLFKGAHLDGSIDWIHKKRGLFLDKIIYLLFFEKFISRN